MRPVTLQDEAAVDAALGFDVAGSPTCGFVDDSPEMGSWSRVVYLEFGGQSHAFDDAWSRLIEDDWKQVSFQGPPAFERDGVQVALVPSPPGMFVSFP